MSRQLPTAQAPGSCAVPLYRKRGTAARSVDLTGSSCPRPGRSTPGSHFPSNRGLPGNAVDRAFRLVDPDYCGTHLRRFFEMCRIRSPLVRCRHAAGDPAVCWVLTSGMAYTGDAGGGDRPRPSGPAVRRVPLFALHDDMVTPHSDCCDSLPPGIRQTPVLGRETAATAMWCRKYSQQSLSRVGTDATPPDSRRRSRSCHRLARPRSSLPAKNRHRRPVRRRTP